MIGCGAREIRDLFIRGRPHAPARRRVWGCCHRSPATKAPTSVSGPYDDIPWDPAVTQQVDWEAELGVVIGVIMDTEVEGIGIMRNRIVAHG
ncbi:MAG: fumarylacetoacetate hydrolase family protein [Vicinamibacterales bacterium]